MSKDLFIICGVSMWLGVACTDSGNGLDFTSSGNNDNENTITVTITNHNTYLPGSYTAKREFYPLPMLQPLVLKPRASMAECPSVEHPNSTDFSLAPAPFGYRAKN